MDWSAEALAVAIVLDELVRRLSLATSIQEATRGMPAHLRPAEFMRLWKVIPAISSAGLVEFVRALPTVLHKTRALRLFEQILDGEVVRPTILALLPIDAMALELRDSGAAMRVVRRLGIDSNVRRDRTDLMSLRQFCAKAHVSPGTVRMLVQDGLLRPKISEYRGRSQYHFSKEQLSQVIKRLGSRLDGESIARLGLEKDVAARFVVSGVVRHRAGRGYRMRLSVDDFDALVRELETHAMPVGQIDAAWISLGSRLLWKHFSPQQLRTMLEQLRAGTRPLVRVACRPGLSQFFVPVEEIVPLRRARRVRPTFGGDGQRTLFDA